MPSTLTRRGLLCGGAAATALAAMPRQSAAQNENGAWPVIGMATTGFRSLTNAQLAQELAAQGIQTIQFYLTQTDSNYWKYNIATDVSDLSAARCREIAGAYRSAGLSIHSMGVYANLIHPDPAERAANMAYFEAMMRIGGYMGIHAFVSEAGNYSDPADPAPKVEYHFQTEVWDRMIKTGRELATMAEAHDATIMFEPFYRHFLCSAKRTRLFLEEADSPRLRVLLDPANLLEVNGVDEMFRQLTPWIDCIHAKDRKYHVDKGVPAGQGDLDYNALVRLAKKHTPGVPLILEYVNEKDYKDALAHLRGVLAAAE